MIVTFNNHGIPDGSLDYTVTNNSDQDINMRIEFVSAVNADGTGFELCFGQCFIDLVVGQTSTKCSRFSYYPFRRNYSNLPGDHFAATVPSY